VYKWQMLLIFSTYLLASPVNHLNKVGEGEMRYLFWTLYLAEFFTESTAHNTDNKSKALRITYYKKISRQALVDATEEQWQHLGFQSGTISQWSAHISNIWPDIEPGDELTLVISPTGYSQFYFDEKLIGKIDDTTFGNAFISIWLSENTTEPKLRQQLLGLIP